MWITVGPVFCASKTAKTCLTNVTEACCLCRYDHIKISGGRGGGGGGGGGSGTGAGGGPPGVDVTSRGSNSSGPPMSGAGPPSSLARQAKKSLVLRDRGR